MGMIVVTLSSFETINVNKFLQNVSKGMVRDVAKDMNEKGCQVGDEKAQLDGYVVIIAALLSLKVAVEMIMMENERLQSGEKGGVGVVTLRVCVGIRETGHS